MAVETKGKPEPTDIVQKMVYGISHDMGAPLRSVVRFSELLKQRAGERLSERENYWLQLILDGGMKAQNMVDGLLVYSRLSTEAKQSESIDLTRLMDLSMGAQIRQLSGINGVSHTRESLILRGDVPPFEGIFDHWVMFFSCIFNNSLLYQPRDEAHQPQITVTFGMQQMQNFICIADNGLGISAEQISNLTRHFWRGYSEADFPGVGMGLSYCERIAQMHGGHLAFEAASGGGFQVTYWYQKE